MMKGHVQIELHNHRTGFKDRIEGDNLITDAMNYLIPNYIGGGYSADYVMPLCKRIFGGVMLFDGRLEEKTDNIFFPGNVHLIASAGQVTNTSNANAGSINTSECLETDTGYQTTWDFGTSQANGTIHSIALTFADRSNGYTRPFWGYNPDCPMHYARRMSDLSTSCEIKPLCYDVKNQYLYYIGITDGNSTSSRYDSTTRKYYYTTNCTIYKEYIPTSLYGLADNYNRGKAPEKVTTFSFEREGNSSNVAYCFFNGYDGYAYLVAEYSNSTGNGYFEYWTLKLSDYSFELSNKKKITIKSCHLSNRWEVVSNGYAYLRSYDLKSIYMVNLSNPVDILQATLPKGYTFTTDTMTVLRNGGVKFLCYRVKAGTTNVYEYFLGICYPDSKIVIDTRNMESGTNYKARRIDLISDNLMTWGCTNESYSGYGFAVNNYLGSIFNLPTPIVKTAASSMKVIYTLTNAEEKE